MSTYYVHLKSGSSKKLENVTSAPVFSDIDVFVDDPQVNSTKNTTTSTVSPPADVTADVSYDYTQQANVERKETIVTFTCAAITGPPAIEAQSLVFRWVDMYGFSNALSSDE